MAGHTSNYQEIIIPFIPALKKIQQTHNLSQSELILIFIIKRSNLNGKKITVRDITYIINYNYYTVNNIVHRLKKNNYITLNRDYQLTRQGESVIKAMHLILSNEFERINNYLGLTRSKTKQFREAIYSYRKKK